LKTKVALLLPVAMVAALLVLRYAALSRTGMPFAWMLYLALPDGVRRPVASNHFRHLNPASPGPLGEW
jgi:hypothetical protein